MQRDIQPSSKTGKADVDEWHDQNRKAGLRLMLAIESNQCATAWRRELGLKLAKAAVEIQDETVSPDRVAALLADLADPNKLTKESPR